MKMKLLNSSVLNYGAQSILNGNNSILRNITLFILLSLSLLLLGIERSISFINPLRYRREC